MTKSLDEAKLNEAAEALAEARRLKYKEDLAAGDTYEHSVKKIYRDGFRDGALWAEKHSPKVLELIEYLELIVIQRENFPDAAAENCIEFAAEALANFRGGEGK